MVSTAIYQQFPIAGIRHLRLCRAVEDKIQREYFFMAAAETVKDLLSGSLISIVIQHDCDRLRSRRCVRLNQIPVERNLFEQVEAVREALEVHSLGIGHSERTRHRYSLNSGPRISDVPS